MVKTTRERVTTLEPDIRSLLAAESRWDRLTAEAERLAARYPSPANRPPLYGVPVGVKDIFHVDGFSTKAGASIPADELAGEEASVVTSLTDAGAVVLGKTVTTEFAFFDPGPTRNPHNLDHTPGGSSSGSAAAVAAGLCPLALGTQTIGSIARPAAFCGVVGVKPSYGRIPMDGVIPVSPSVDHVGYFTQDVTSAALAAAVVYPDWKPVESVPKPRFGVPAASYLEQSESRALEQFENQCESLEAAGYEVVELDLLDNIAEVNERHHRLVAAETAISHAPWFPRYRDRYGPELRELIEDGQAVDAEEIGRSREGRRTLRTAVESVMVEQAIDIILSPSAPGPAPAGLDSTGDPVMNLPWTHCGVPTVTIPAGTCDGLPIGLQCAGRFGRDEWLLAWVASIESVLQA